MNYYHESDSFIADWLRWRIKNGDVPEGKVDERPIWLIEPEDIVGYTQHHFFAGIGGWALALARAGWPLDRPVWTANLHLLPLENKNARHVWPIWNRLIRKYDPVTIFGHQMQNSIKYGWLDIIPSEMEDAGNVFGSIVLGAHSLGAPHIRQRVFWVADCVDGHWIQVLRTSHADKERDKQGQSAQDTRASSTTTGHWSAVEYVPCLDGTKRPVPIPESGICPVAYGIPEQLWRYLLKGYAGSVVIQVAELFIRAYLELELDAS